MALSTETKQQILKEAIVHWSGGRTIQDAINHAIAATEAWVMRHVDGGDNEGFVQTMQTPFEAAVAVNTRRAENKVADNPEVKDPPPPEVPLTAFHDTIAGGIIDPNTALLEKDRLAAQVEDDKGTDDPTLKGHPEGQPRETMNFMSAEGRTVATEHELSPPASDGTVTAAGTQSTLDQEVDRVKEVNDDPRNAGAANDAKTTGEGVDVQAQADQQAPKASQDTTAEEVQAMVRPDPLKSDEPVPVTKGDETVVMTDEERNKLNDETQANPDNNSAATYETTESPADKSS